MFFLFLGNIRHTFLLLLRLGFHPLGSLEHQKSCVAVSEAPGDNQDQRVSKESTNSPLHQNIRYDNVRIYHSFIISSDVLEGPLSSEVADLLLK